MSDLNQVISLGIGSPASVKFFITVGLGIGEAEVITGIVDLTLYPRDITLTLEERDTTFTLRTRTRSLTLQER